MIEIIYDVKDERNFLLQKRKKFNNISDMKRYILSLNGLINRPTIISTRNKKIKGELI